MPTLNLISSPGSASTELQKAEVGKDKQCASSEEPVEGRRVKGCLKEGLSFRRRFPLVVNSLVIAML